MIDAQQHLGHVQDSVHHVSTLVEIGRKPDTPVPPSCISF
jgi:hypothetical protein